MSDQDVPSPPPPGVTAPPPSVPQPPPRQSSGGAWKVVLAVGVVLVLLLFGCCAFFAAFSPVSGDRIAPLGDAVAVIHIDGVIAGTGGRFEGIISPEDVIAQLDEARDDDTVKAVLLRIDSPGGTAAASQEISQEVRRFAEEKPVVASVGDIGASGAYMVASQCDEIVASPGSGVGSIGVIMEIPNVAGLLDKLGVEFTTLKQGKYKDMGSPYRSLTPSETAFLDAQMKIVYEQFIADVAEGRDLPESKVRELATGAVFLGVEAEKSGLVDRIGNYSDAVDRAAELGGIEGEPAIVTYDEPRLQDLLGGIFSIRSSLERIGAATDLTGARPPSPR